MRDMLAEFSSPLQRGRTPESAESRPSLAPVESQEELQRGRTPESAERPTVAASGRSLRGGFNGAALRRVRRDLKQKRRTARASGLQRGRTPESAERRQRRKSKNKMSNASTGPHSGECGELASLVAEAIDGAIASTGPHAGECGEGSDSEALVGGGRSFNGAALRRVRRGR